MINKIFRIYILILLFSSAGIFAFADEPSSSLDDKPSVDTAATAAVQVPAVPADTSSASTSTSYLYDLKKLIEKSRENIKQVNEKIKEQAVLKRNQKREERAREYYEKGVELTNEGKLDEARDYFEKAIRITEHPEMAGYIRESQQRLRKQESALQAQEREHYHQIKQDENTRKEDVEEAYRQAVELYKEKKYHPAKDAFEHVDEIAPDYRATDSYLKIIDQDITLADALAVKQQAVEIAHQQSEAEAARAKEKAMWLAQIEEKEKERKEAIDKQAQEVYDEAVVLYKNKKFAEAKKKFEEVSWVIPDYKATMKYLHRIDRDAQEEQDRVAKEQQKALQEQRWEEEVEAKKQEALHQKESQAKELQQKKDLGEQAQFLYTAAVTLYDNKSFQEAKTQFESVEKVVPDFKDTREYLRKLGIIISPSAVAPTVPGPTPVEAMPQPVQSMPAQVKVAVSLEDQQKQAQDIAALAAKSAELYHQIADVADDTSTVETKRKMAQVDDILKNLKGNQDRLLRQMREQEWRHQEEESKAKQEERRAQAVKMYQMAQDYLSSHDYTKAKIEFLALENIFPDYRATHRYLRRIEEYQKRAGVQAVTNYEKAQAEHLKQLQDKENAEEQLRIQQEEQRQHDIELQEQVSLKELAQKASDINDEIIRLSAQQDYQGMKAKFTELENTVTALTTLKNQMAKQSYNIAHAKQLARESAEQRASMLRAQQQEDRQIHAYGGEQPTTEERPVLSSQPSDIDHYKRREVMQEQNTLFSEAVDCYEHKKYTEAKLLFGELSDQHDRRAEAWLRKVDHAITQQLLRSQEGEERERTAFIADQVRAQRELGVIQERERERQKKLTEELERQKRLYEDDRLLQLRKEETMKAHERERQRQEEKRLQLERENEKQQAMLRFHKVETPKPVAVVAQPAAVLPKAVVPPAMSPQQIKAQEDFSNERKAFLDNKYKKEQEEQARQARIKAAADARQARIKADAEAREKRKEERQQAIEHREQLRAQREAERQARIKAAADARQKAQEEKQKEIERQKELKAEEEKHKEELMRQQEQEREEKARQDEILRQEASRRQELERQERERQAQLEVQREDVRKQLEDGVEVMYQEALSLYKQGEYAAAADKFKDVQDILPGYKNAQQYMDEARQKSLNPPPVAAVPDTSASPASSPVAHDGDSVSKALDLFDPNAK